MTYIVLDTETTGLRYKEGDRIVEIGCLEVDDTHTLTGRTYHQYINPEREVHPEAFKVTGLSLDFLKDFPTFKEIAQDFHNFIQGKKLIIHNAQFDVGFINYEFGLLKLPLVYPHQTICTVELAKRKFPGSKVNLDALCKRFKIELDGREKHGALIDCQLLFNVYLGLLDKLQARLDWKMALTKQSEPVIGHNQTPHRFKTLDPYQLTADEIHAHDQLLSKLKKPLWKDYV